MRYLSFIIIAATLFIGLSFAGKVFFGMDHSGMMGSPDCINYCIENTIVQSALPMLSFTGLSGLIIFSLIFSERWIIKHVLQNNRWMRLTEPIKLFLLAKNVSTFILLD